MLSSEPRLSRRVGVVLPDHPGPPSCPADASGEDQLFVRAQGSIRPTPRVIPDAPVRFSRIALFEDVYMCATRRGHTLARGPDNQRLCLNGTRVAQMSDTLPIDLN
jgi:hypothetical protein